MKKNKAIYIAWSCWRLVLYRGANIVFTISEAIITKKIQIGRWRISKISTFDGKNERYYPISQKENTELYRKYMLEAKQYENVYFFGRLGDYKYYNMDQAVERALKLYEDIFAPKTD